MVTVIFTGLACLVPNLAFSASVLKIRDNRILIEFKQDEIIETGTNLSFRSKDGNRKASLIVRQVKGKRAIAELVSGQVQVGDDIRVLEKEAPPSRAKSPPAVLEKEAPPIRTKDAAPANRKIRTNQASWQLHMGLSRQTQTVQLTTTTASLEGMALHLRAMRSERLFKMRNLEWEALLALEQLKASGSISVQACGGGSACSFEALALSPGARLAYLPWGVGKYHAKFKAGLDFALPITLSSNVVAQTGLTPLTFLTLGASMRVGIGANEYLPLSLETSLYQAGGITISRLLFTVGYRWQ